MNQVQDIFNGVYDADEDDEEAGEEVSKPINEIK